MELSININYRTNWGESVYIVGNTIAMGNDNEDKSAKLSMIGYDLWNITIEVPRSTAELKYRFIVKSENGNIKREWGKGHTLSLNNSLTNISIFDKWHDIPFNKHYYSSAFVSGINKRNCNSNRTAVKPGNALFTISAPNINSDETLAISGNIEELGQWDPSKALVLNDALFPQWSTNVALKEGYNDIEYKFLIIDKKTGKIRIWENSDNHSHSITLASKNDAFVFDHLYFSDPKSNWRGAGTAIPVFSLRSESDFGVGDFYDLYQLIDWAVETKQNIIQILPINDTTMTHTWTDSYPYNANSTFALHPMYLRLEAIGALKDKKRVSHYNQIKCQLNALTDIDYEEVNKYKNAYLREYYNENINEILSNKELNTFVENNREWLIDYAAFCLLRDKYKTPDFKTWSRYNIYNSTEVRKFIESNKKDAYLIYFIQYNLDKQLSEVRNYAHDKGVVLKGDIPIGISRTSADAWVHYDLFNMDCQAGAPPDDFSILGQNWGFPTYNWEQMSKDGFKWWKDRFAKMANYFDAYRIDHILGFFRIWEIPMDAVHGLLGTFNPALPYSIDEMKSNYDFWLNVDLHTKPYIMDYFLYDFFGDKSEYVKDIFLDDCGYGRYSMKEFVNSQKKIVNYFETNKSDILSENIKDGLLGLIDQVLFIEDKHSKGYYHPRISAQFTYTYKSLNDYEKWCFDRLYNDFFYHRHNDFWYGKAMWKLPPLINSTDMLVCGEDLGMIPDCVSSVMQSQQILSLEIQRMPKDPKVKFGNPGQYPYLSVSTTSTHDMSGIRGWWEENSADSQLFYNQMLGESGKAPFYAEPWICDKIITQHLNSPSMLSILPLQDWLSIDGSIRRQNPKEEQINIPANSRHYWRYRMHLSLNELLSYNDFNSRLKSKIEDSGR